MKIRLKGYKIVRDIKVVLGKMILYGPNAAGKTRLMEILAILTNIEDNERIRDILDSIHFHIADDFEIEVETESTTLKITRSNGFFTARTIDREIARKPGLEETIKLARELLDEYGHRLPKRPAWIDACSAYTTRAVIRVCGGVREQNYDLLMQLEPDEFNELKSLLSLTTDITDLVYLRDQWWAREGEHWVPVTSLAYGVRRVISILASMVVSDALFIEMFEAGLHVDMAQALLDVLSQRQNTTVILETHHGMIVAYGVANGWRAYYVENGRTIHEITRVEDLANADLFRREVETYAM